eukprot:7843270-Pyramimonas_sp.AAC.1
MGRMRIRRAGRNSPRRGERRGEGPRMPPSARVFIRFGAPGRLLKLGDPGQTPNQQNPTVQVAGSAGP